MAWTQLMDGHGDAGLHSVPPAPTPPPLPTLVPPTPTYNTCRSANAGVGWGVGKINENQKAEIIL